MINLKSVVFSIFLATVTTSLPSPTLAQQLSCNNGVILRGGNQVSTESVRKLITNAKKEITRTQKRLTLASKSAKKKLLKKIKTLKSNLKLYQQILKVCVVDPNSDTDPTDNNPNQRIKITAQKFNGYTLTVFEDTKKYSEYDSRDSIYIPYIDENGDALVSLGGIASTADFQVTGALYRWNGNQISPLCAPNKCSLATFQQSPPLNGRGIIGISKAASHKPSDDLDILLWNEKGFFPLEGYTRGDATLQDFALNTKGEVISLELNSGRVARWSSVDGKALPSLDLNAIVASTAIALENGDSKTSGCAPRGTRRLKFAQFGMAPDGTMAFELQNEYDCTQYGQSGRGIVSAHLVIENGSVTVLEGSIYSPSSISDLPPSLEAIGSGGTTLLRSADEYSSIYFAHGKRIRETAVDTIYDRYSGVNSRGEVIATRVKELSTNPTDNYVSLDTGFGPTPLKAILGVAGTTHFNKATDINECGEISGTLRYTDKIEEFNKAFIASPDRCK